VHNIKWQHILIAFIQDVILFELLADNLLIVEEQRIKLACHQFWFLVIGNGLCYVFIWKNICFSDSCPTNHYLVIVFIFSNKFVKIEMSISHFHYILKSFFAHRCEILWRFELRLVYDKIKHYFFLVSRHELAFVD